MRLLFIVLALSVVPALADERAKPNALTPEQIADGWILLFDGETTFGWTVEGEAKPMDGMFILNGASAGASISATTAFQSFACEYEVSRDRKTWGNGRISFRLHDSGIGTGRRIQNMAAAGLISVTHKDGAVSFNLGAGRTAYLRSIRVRPTLNIPLFNGIDLTGWKLYDPAKAKAADAKAKEVKVTSKYTVTKEGWLNVKDGPGDLQTEGQWADFVLQLECISNGKHLNSGLFFRCVPELYQQGYESQIRNQWEGDDRTKPVDFGTGAIYRRQAARKVVSTDGEWFTMTVAAHGRHIATWVNGYQVVDWTDDRKESDNARQGFKKSKGAISIQGHDPTTDLSFRNIRIQSLDPN